MRERIRDTWGNVRQPILCEGKRPWVETERESRRSPQRGREAACEKQHEERKSRAAHSSRSPLKTTNNLTLFWRTEQKACSVCWWVSDRQEVPPFSPSPCLVVLGKWQDLGNIPCGRGEGLWRNALLVGRRGWRVTDIFHWGLYSSRREENTEYFRTFQEAGNNGMFPALHVRTCILPDWHDGLKIKKERKWRGNLWHVDMSDVIMLTIHLCHLHPQPQRCWDEMRWEGKDGQQLPYKSDNKQNGVRPVNFCFLPGIYRNVFVRLVCHFFRVNFGFFVLVLANITR